MSDNLIDRIHDSMEKKARESKEYYLDAWSDHISNLNRLVSLAPGGLSFDRYLEIKKELLDAASATWDHNHKEKAA